MSEVSRLATETAVSTGRAEEQGAPPEERLLDAAERLLVSVGYAGITTRRLAEEAGVNHGLVHYYFGSNDNLLVRALERFTERLIARQSDLYASDLPFVEKWRTAMRFLTENDLGYEKVWLELQALGWNDPDLRERFSESQRGMAGGTPAAFETLHPASDPHPSRRRGGAGHDLQPGTDVERLGRVETGHKELLEWIDRWLSSSV